MGKMSVGIVGLVVGIAISRLVWQMDMVSGIYLGGIGLVYASGWIGYVWMNGMGKMRWERVMGVWMCSGVVAGWLLNIGEYIWL